ncbi:MAG: nucleotidyltransferase family protein [Acidobacteria bacterium]|nr:nucleotidyltransferase family protein [Acidobacteriota bacterium]
MIAAIVLAAGQATRFGRCKQLMPLAGKPLLQHVLDNLRQSKIEDVVVVLGAHAEEIREGIRFERERVVFNADFAQGMSTSIQAGLRALSEGTEATMIVLADQPYVNAQTFDALIDAYRQLRTPIVVPTYGGKRGNPVVVDRSLFAEMMELRGDVGFRALFGNREMAKVAVADRGVVIDIDSPGDLE